MAGVVSQRTILPAILMRFLSMFHYIVFTKFEMDLSLTAKSLNSVRAAQLSQGFVEPLMFKQQIAALEHLDFIRK